MADYQRMYAILCSSVAAVIPALEEIPAANPSMRILQQALLNAEELYIQTTPLCTVAGNRIKHHKTAAARSLIRNVPLQFFCQRQLIIWN